MKITIMTKFSTRKREKQVVFEEKTLLHDEACKECYNQKQRLINEDDYDEDYDEDDEIPNKKNACNNYYKQNRTKNNQLFS